jgi:hypothetical protein
VAADVSVVDRKTEQTGRIVQALSQRNTKLQDDVRKTDALLGKVQSKMLSIGRSLGKMAAIEIGRDLLELDPDLVKESDAAFALDQLIRVGANIGLSATTGNPAVVAVAALGSLVATMRATISRMESRQNDLERTAREARQTAEEAFAKASADFAKASERTEDSIIRMVGESMRRIREDSEQWDRYRESQEAGA